MSRPQIGATIPDCELPATSGEPIRLSRLRGRWLILYFYPKANTAGCTRQGIEFSAAYSQAQALNAAILGVSRDSLKVQQGFQQRQDFPFPLLADKEEQLCHLFDVIQPKMMYGKQVRGIERSTFLIDPEGILRQEWRKVKVDGHVASVLAALATLQQRDPPATGATP